VGHPQHVEQRSRAFLRFGAWHLLDMHGRQPHVVQRREVLEQRVQLEHEAHLPVKGADGLVSWQLARAQPYAIDLDFAGLEGLQAGDGTQHGGLAASGETHERDDLASHGPGVHPAEDLARPATQPKTPHVEHRPVQAVGIFHRSSSRRARCDKGSDIAR
jgi:hypothetical protein